MQTMYYKTSSFIQHTGNLIDLTELRRRQAASAQQDSLARQPESVWYPEEPAAQEESGFRPVVLTMTKTQRRRAGWERRAWVLDVCASLGVVLMTALFVLRIML